MTDKYVISMFAEPPGVPVRRSSHKMKCPEVEVIHGNLIWGTIYGHYCTIMLDSASNYATISYSYAKKIHIITGFERRTPIDFELWYCKKLLKVIILPKVTILLENRVKVRTSLLVMPKEVEEAWDYPDVVLDIHIFHWGKMLHVFNGDKSVLYIRDPGTLGKRFPRLHERFNVFLVGKPHDPEAPYDPDEHKLFTVLLDTTTANFHLSDIFKQQFVPYRLLKEKWFVHLYLVNGCCLKPEEVRSLPSPNHHFVIGRNLLFKHNAMIDYGNHFVDFQFGHNIIRVHLIPDTTSKHDTVAFHKYLNSNTASTTDQNTASTTLTTYTSTMKEEEKKGKKKRDKSQ